MGGALNIRLASALDIQALPEIERSAALAFADIPDLAWVEELPLIPESEHSIAVEEKTCWVAELDGELVGFLLATKSGRELYIRELSVSSTEQRKGVGTDLINAVIEASRDAVERVTLTTFRDVPWNRPFYERLGFSVVVAPTEKLLRELVREKNAGLPIHRRCAMEMVL